MPKTDTRLRLAQQYDKEAEDHIRKTIESEQAAIAAATPAERERHNEIARQERDAAITSLKDATIAFGPAIKELQEDADALE